MSPAEAVACVEKFPSLLALADGGSRRGPGSGGVGGSVGVAVGMEGVGVGVGLEGSGRAGAEGRDGFGSVTSGGLAARIDRLHGALVRGGILAPPSPHASYATSAISAMSSSSASFSSSVPPVLDEGAQALLRRIVTQCPRVRLGVCEGCIWGCI